MTERLTLLTWLTLIAVALVAVTFVTLWLMAARPGRAVVLRAGVVGVYRLEASEMTEVTGWQRQQASY